MTTNDSDRFERLVRNMAATIAPQELDDWFAGLSNKLDDIQIDLEQRHAGGDQPSITWTGDDFGGYDGVPGDYHIHLHLDDDGDIKSCSVWKGDFRIGGAKTVDGAKAFAERHAAMAADEVVE